MFLQNINGRFRLVNSAWTQEIFSVDQSGNVNVAGRLRTNEFVEVGGVATAGHGCSPNGLIARDANGLILSCQSGVWAQVSGSQPSGMVAFFVSSSCPTGWLHANGTNGTPDLRGEFIRGLDSGRGVDPGRTLGTFQIDTSQRITGEFSNFEEPFAWGSGAFAGSSPGARWYGGAFFPSAPRIMTFDSARVARTSNENRPRNVALLPCVKS